MSCFKLEINALPNKKQSPVEKPNNFERSSKGTDFLKKNILSFHRKPYVMVST